MFKLNVCGRCRKRIISQRIFFARRVLFHKTMKRTIFNSPWITPFLRALAGLLMRLAGWKVEGSLPDLPKFVVVGAPHTSNWDFVLFLGAAFLLRVNARFLGKAELFRPPFGFFFYWCGGTPVDRSKPNGLVEQIVKAIQDAPEFILVVTPEGTRGRVDSWKSGFYHIARGAGIPIVPAYPDGKRKVVGVGAPFALTGDPEKDMRDIQAYFAKYEGLKPKR